ncbi:PHP domain-containing protein [Cellulomonas shaoxiangyii]|uniref:PHP domain-containing protein n=1 Tax=Cellulomonas shaoxiangyii TaxID=2566013 RepID=A0A4P7SH94_9CELL|nr:PHP domain-containing protein [Cellulomonas shaoxiangyii]QCB93579.1 PHP domain-containing protein [Cellulomonas shaoxiangyii]TGY85716.1 PHP domain-containing protein [Cellulomonas shaoxiangyii]
MTAADDRDRAVATLRRIAFLLERAQASSYRPAAYRAAARAVERQEPDRLHALAAAGALTELPAVGAKTADVVARALAGRPVAVLDGLEQEAAAAAAGTPDDAAGVLLAALRGDLHAHTDASDGATPMQEMVLAALELGHDYLAITDHSPRLTVANGLSAARLRAQLGQVEALRRAVAPFDVLTGIEVDVLDDGGLDQDPALLDELDVVVASVHSKLRMDRASMTARMLAAVRNPRTDVLGHCTGRRLTGRQRPPSEFDAEAVFAACAEHGVAVEINSRPDRLDPPHALLDVAVAAGCEFTIDSDAHAPGQLAWLRAGCERAAAHGIGPDRVVTTRTADDVRARGHRAPARA